jgi:hypothetical protein
MICIPKLALEIQDLLLPAIVLLPSVKLLKLLVANHYCALDRGKGRISDPVLKIMDLHGLIKGGHIPLGLSGMAIVLLHMGSAVLVKSKILAFTTVVQAL